ncbi:hypothetical protein [Streptomyces morookaense]|uniref:Uncharacterized protein n=1 Tax=Streptomyces morookaense TaxID=1970 RepID=A0A7Y7E973_STRMO|nr:hypothetical protein [Streptomyces morookaense]NVK80116.1 hypothetical protein [Streptomyces morookaense]GHF29557.1 hypothetical protein GCM10010359_35060 [Streptomyces morookaense]
MNAIQQHMLDLHRAARHQQPAPPAPGTGEAQALREIRTWWRFRAVVDERAAARSARWSALLGLLRPGRRSDTATAPVGRPSAAQASRPLQHGSDRVPDVCGRPAQC